MFLCNEFEVNLRSLQHKLLVEICINMFRVQGRGFSSQESREISDTRGASMLYFCGDAKCRSAVDGELSPLLALVSCKGWNNLMNCVLRTLPHMRADSRLATRQRRSILTAYTL